jgi:hypothetical protein
VDTILADGAGSFKVTWPDAYCRLGQRKGFREAQTLLRLSRCGFRGEDARLLRRDLRLPDVGQAEQGTGKGQRLRSHRILQVAMNNKAEEFGEASVAKGQPQWM